MLNGRNNRFFLLWEKVFFLIQNIFIVPAMRHDSRTKSLFLTKFGQETLTSLLCINLILGRGVVDRTDHCEDL